ncbi:hypothetical protein IW262DRAFT_1417884 [Armillaria fumosa]|nr:hypothetical protein IW262DRAFT_1417884 [Armillaria fumosa]
MWESAYRIFFGCPNLVIDLQSDVVLNVFRNGLQDLLMSREGSSYGDNEQSFGRPGCIADSDITPY